MKKIIMIVYNATIKVNWGILEEWIAWQLDEQIPATLATGLFDDYKFYRLLEQDEEEGPSFIVQYFTSSLERYQEFMISFAADLQQEAQRKWGGGFIAFRTLMASV